MEIKCSANESTDLANDVAYLACLAKSLREMSGNCEWRRVYVVCHRE